jgi:hypothetical protein
MGPAWHDNPDIARRIAWPTPYPGGPAAVAGATVGKRQRQVHPKQLAIDMRSLLTFALGSIHLTRPPDVQDWRVP